MISGLDGEVFPSPSPIVVSVETLRIAVIRSILKLMIAMSRPKTRRSLIVTSKRINQKVIFTKLTRCVFARRVPLVAHV